MELQLGQTYKVEVIKIIDYGCVVRLEDRSTELIHLSQISPKFVKHVEEFVSIGDVFEAQGVPGLKNPVQLSLKHLNLVSPYANANKQDNQSNNRNSRPSVKESSRADNRSVHMPKSDNRGFKKVDDHLMDGYESKDDDYVPHRSKPRSSSKKFDSHKPNDDAYFMNKQRRKDRRSHNNRHRKDNYFD